MGKTQSKNSDNNGEIVNNVIIEDTVSVENSKIIILLIIIAAVKVAEFLYALYKDHKRGLKKKYLSEPAVIKV